MRELTIAGRRIADDEPCFVIAEVGHNHGGKIETAKQLIQAAAGCGASAVKFQKRDNANLYTAQLLEQPYDHEHSYGATYGSHREALEFGWQEYVSSRAIAKACGMPLFATAFDERSADFLMELDVPAFKIASGDLTNTPLLKHVAGMGKPIILSTGGGTLDDIDRAVVAITAKTRELAVLHCTAAYPVRDFAELNLSVIPVLCGLYPDLVIGWSGHDSGIAMSVMAYTLGARIIEKHFTLNRAMKGTDHAFSLEPAGLRSLVRDLSRARLGMGDGQKRRYESENGPLRKMAKSLVAIRDLPAGHLLTAADLARKSPGDGLPPYYLEQVTGFTLARRLAKDEILTFDHLKAKACA